MSIAPTSAKTLLKEIRALEKKLPQAQNKELILIIGNTGAGKSTFVNYLAGKTFSKLKGPYQELVDCQDPIVRIGHGPSSCTEIPEFYTDAATGLTFCDCPGFFDTKSLDQQILNAFAMRSIAKTCRAVKGAILCMEFASLLSKRAQELEVSLQMAARFLGTTHSLFLLVTKTPSTGLNILEGVGQNVATIAALLREGSIGFYSPTDDLPAGQLVYDRNRLQQRVRSWMQRIPNLSLALNAEASNYLNMVLGQLTQKVIGHFKHFFPAQKISKLIQVKEQFQEVVGAQNPSFAQFDTSVYAQLQLLQGDPLGIIKLTQLGLLLPRSFRPCIDSMLYKMQQEAWQAADREAEKTRRISALERQIQQLQYSLSLAQQQATQANQAQAQVRQLLDQQQRAGEGEAKWRRLYEQEKSEKEAAERKLSEVRQLACQVRELAEARALGAPHFVVMQPSGFYPGFF